MRFRDLSKQLKQGNRLHKVNLFARKMSATTMVICTQAGQKRVSLGLPSLTMSEKGMSMEEAELIRQAMAMRDEMEARIDSHGIGAMRTLQTKGKEKISDVMTLWSESFLVEQTRKNALVVKSRLTEAIGSDLQVSKVRREHFVAMMELMAKNKKHPNTIRYQASRLRSFCNWASERGYMPRIDTRKLLPAEQFGEVKALTVEELNKLAATPLKVWPDVKDMFLFGVYTAQRVGEIEKYTYQILEDGYISVQQGKTGKHIMVPLSENAVAIIKRVKKRHGKVSAKDVIFSDLPAKPNARKAFKQWLRDAGVDPDKATLHNSRSTAISLLINAGVSESTTQELANHASPVTTARYYRRIDQRKKEEALSLIPKFGK
jgi:integrase